jgi:hypothetical protein
MAVADRKEKYSLDFFCFLFFVKKKKEVGAIVIMFIVKSCLGKALKTLLLKKTVI